MKRRIEKILNPKIAALLLLAIIALGATVLISRPHRSVVAYCKVYHQENQKLTGSHGSTYSVAVFSHSSINAKDFAKAFANLERVAPAEIEPDVKALKAIFDKISQDPSQTLTASLSGIGAESSVKTWTDNHCSD
jgi:hypothetical protein